MNYLIIGNSAAAVGCVEGIRQQDPDSAVTLVASEPYHTYSRPLISYLLGGKTDQARMRYRPAGFYEVNKVKTLLGKTATAILPDKKQVTLKSGETLPYDKLLVAAGSSPSVPPVKGLDKVKNKTAFLTLDDARYLEQRVKADTKVLILGAGLIGLKCAEGLRGRTPHIAVVDLADHILPSILDAEAALPIQRHISGQGVELVLSDAVQSFDRENAILKSGRIIPFDLLVVAVGVRPNTDLVAQAGGKVGRGVATDTFCRTSLPDVYAAGDCAESRDITTGADRVLALLPNAYMQGECAGIHMAGGEKPYDKAIPMNAIGFFGLHMITAGSYDGQEYRSDSGGCLKRLFYKDNLLRGYILIGDVGRAGIYTSLIRERVPLSSIDFELIKEKPQLMAFSSSERAKKLGGVRI